MQLRYIADTHLYDTYSLEWRPEFSNLDLYAMHLIDSWNAFTAKDDVTIMVGDVGQFCKRTVEVLKRLNGRIILVIGNHDISWGRNMYTCGVFAGIHDSIDTGTVYIQHKPTEGTNSVSKYFVHGHHHRYDMPGMQNKLIRYANDVYRFNCSADLNNHRPCTLQELMLNKELLLEKYKERGILSGGN